MAACLYYKLYCLYFSQSIPKYQYHQGSFSSYFFPIKIPLLDFYSGEKAVRVLAKHKSWIHLSL